MRWCLLVLLPAAMLFGVADGGWLKNVPARDHEKTNPYHDQADAVAAGRRIFADRCSHCHGENAEGTKKHPPLKSDRVQHLASEGDLPFEAPPGARRQSADLINAQGGFATIEIADGEAEAGRRTESRFN